MKSGLLEFPYIRGIHVNNSIKNTLNRKPQLQDSEEKKEKNAPEKVNWRMKNLSTVLNSSEAQRKCYRERGFPLFLSSWGQEFSQKTVCAAWTVGSLLAKQIPSKKGKNSLSLHCARVFISMGRIVSLCPLQYFSFSLLACLAHPLLAPKVVWAHDHGPEKQGVHSDKRDGFPSLSSIFPSCFRGPCEPAVLLSQLFCAYLRLWSSAEQGLCDLSQSG